MVSLVLVPGLASDETMWQSQLEALADWKPIVTDAHFRSATIEAMAATLLEEHEGPLVLCGASMGGMVAMEAVRQAPDRVRGLALLGTNARAEDAQMRKLREAAIVLYLQGRIAEVIEPNVAFAFHPRKAGDPLIVQRYLSSLLAAGGAQLAVQNRAVIERPDARRHLAQVHCPVLVMCGDVDKLTPLECSQEIAQLVPHAELVVVPECGHMLTMEQPDFVNDTLARWLARVAI